MTAAIIANEGDLFERPEAGVSIQALDAANNTLTGIMDELSNASHFVPPPPLRDRPSRVGEYDIGPVSEDVLKDGIWAAGTMEDMVGGAVVLNSVIKSVKRQQDRSTDILPQDIQIGDQYIPEGELRLPDLALRPGAPAYEVVKSSTLFVGKHPDPEQGITVGQHVQIPGNATDEEVASAIAGLTEISPEEMKSDSSKAGYWSMRLPSLRAPVVEKAMQALNLMVGRSSMACAYIDSPQVLLRFDFRRRDFSGMRQHSSWEDGQSLWRGICCDARNERHRELERMQPGTKPLYAEDIVQLTKDDGDALIVPSREYQEKIPAALIGEYTQLLKGLLIRKFVYSGRNLFVKRSRNDLFMSYKCLPEEVRARELLCEMIGYDEYIKYIRRGFIVVKGKSGKQYKISGGYSMISVYGKNEAGAWEHFEDLCIQFKGYNLTHTDAVIMRKLFVENDENQLYKKSNASKRNQTFDEVRQQRRSEQKNPVREVSQDQILTWESQQDRQESLRDREDIARRLAAGLARQEQRVG